MASNTGDKNADIAYTKWWDNRPIEEFEGDPRYSAMTVAAFQNKLMYMSSKGTDVSKLSAAELNKLFEEEMNFQAGATMAMSGAAVAITKNVVTTTTQRVFWSGGDVAQEAAENWAKQNNGTTLEMYLKNTGNNLEEVTKTMPWKNAKPMWENVSRDFAKGASDVVHVFQKAEGVGVKSIWGNTEYPELINNQGVKEIIYHIIKPDGKINIFKEILR
ncbi:MAG: shlA 3 [Clostridia bacterium]|nr:shlA 3 [Clostridia bacterium]